MSDDARTTYLDALDIHARYGFALFTKKTTPAELEDSLIDLAITLDTPWGPYLRQTFDEIFTPRGVASGVAILDRIIEDLDQEAEGPSPIVSVDEIFAQFTAMRDLVPVGIAVAFQTGDRRFELRTNDLLVQHLDRLIGLLVEKVA